jgi:hypothetical protein
MSTYTGVQAKFAAKTDNTVAYTDVDDTLKVTIKTGRDVIERWKMGDSNVQEIKKGKKHVVAITIERDYKGGNFSAIGTTLAAASQDDVTTYYGALFPEGDASPKFLIGPGAFHDWELTADLDGTLKEKAEFEGTILAVT